MLVFLIFCRRVNIKEETNARCMYLVYYTVSLKKKRENKLAQKSEPHIMVVVAPKMAWILTVWTLAI